MTAKDLLRWARWLKQLSRQHTLLSDDRKKLGELADELQSEGVDAAARQVERS